MRKTLTLCLALLGTPATFAADAKAPGLTAAECEVWNRERTFAESVDHHDKIAFAEHVHPDAVFGAASPNTQRGREAILAAWNGTLEGKNVQLVWRPQFVSIGTDTNVAMSRGPFTITTQNDKGETTHLIGQFVSVWVRKDAKSPWYVVLDGGGPPPTSATEEQAKQHLAAAPAACPK